MKTIIMVGVLDIEGSTNISIAKSFVKFGYSVIPINYRTIINNKGMQYFEDTLFDSIDKYSPDIIMFCKTDGISPDVIKKCKKSAITFYWFMDPIETAILCGSDKLAKEADFTACTGGGVVHWMVEQGVTKCSHIFEGIDHDIFKPVASVRSLETDISFIGTRTEERDFFISALRSAGYKIKAYGLGYDEEAINKKFAQVCASSKMMLSVNTFSTIPDYCSDRLFRYMSCGVCTLHYDPINTMSKYVTDDEAILFKDMDDLLKKLSNLTDKQRGNIAINGREKVLRNHTWDQTVNTMLLAMEKLDESSSSLR